MNERQIAEFDERRELDFAVGLEDKGRFRVNAFHQRGAPGMVIRYLQQPHPTPARSWACLRC